MSLGLVVCFALSVTLEDSSPDAAFRGSGQLWGWGDVSLPVAGCSL